MKNHWFLTISTILLTSLWFLYFPVISVSETATNYFRVVQHFCNKTFILGALWILTAKSEIDCARVCSTSFECLAFIYEKRDQRCLGYQFRINVSMDYEHYPGALYYDKEIHCGTPPRKEYANVDVSLTTARYYCNNQKNFPVFAKGNPLSYCLPNGKWSINNFTCKVVESCKDVFMCNPAAEDGHFVIYPVLTNRHPVKVYCHNINSTPAEYITFFDLNMSVNNYSILTEDCTWKERIGDKTTIFRKLRVDVTSMSAVRDDFTFADLTNENESDVEPWIQPIFGYGADCSAFSSTCPKLGYFIINLKGTGLRLDTKLQWRGVGYRPSIDWFNTGSFAEGKCGGWCGGCTSAEPMKLYIDTTQNIDTASTETVVNCSP